ncbi:hypothetical protein F5ESL0225_02045 [Lactobacillus sp. ESL0225]|nr:hypothetical protein F5ESL0225_02045 [Lactobacillus sp. ESL0225]
MDVFDQKIRGEALFEDDKYLFPFVQHSSLEDNHLYITFASVVSMYFVCQSTKGLSDGYVHILMIIMLQDFLIVSKV